MLSSLGREIVAGMATVIAALIATVFALHTLRTYELWKYNGWFAQVWPPLSITLFMVGSVLFNGSLFLGRHLYNQDFDVELVDPLLQAGVFLGLTIKVAAGVGMIRQFTFQGFGKHAWIYALVLCVAIGLYSYISYAVKWGVN